MRRTLPVLSVACGWSGLAQAHGDPIVLWYAAGAMAVQVVMLVRLLLTLPRISERVAFGALYLGVAAFAWRWAAGTKADVELTLTGCMVAFAPWLVTWLLARAWRRCVLPARAAKAG